MFTIFYRQLVGFFYRRFWETVLSLSLSILSPQLFLLFLNTMEDLTTNWNHLMLSNKEGSGCCLDEEVSSQEFFLHKVSNKKDKKH